MLQTYCNLDAAVWVSCYLNILLYLLTAAFNQ